MISPMPIEDTECESDGICDDCLSDNAKSDAWDQAAELSDTLSNYTIAALMHMCKSRMKVTDPSGEYLLSFEITGVHPYCGDIQIRIKDNSNEKED